MSFGGSDANVLKNLPYNNNKFAHSHQLSSPNEVSLRTYVMDTR
jgi:hypothetical protein